MLFVELTTQEVDRMKVKKEPEIVTFEKKSNLMTFAKQISKWIHLFDPENISFF